VEFVKSVAGFGKNSYSCLRVLLIAFADRKLYKFLKLTTPEGEEVNPIAASAPSAVNSETTGNYEIHN
jgi:hypothetical protein